MKKVLVSTALCASLMFAANSEYKYEVTPMLGGAVTEGNLDLDRNYANAGLAVGFNLDDSMFDQIELGFLRTIEDVDYDNSNSDTAITRFFTNVVKEYSLNDNSSLYALVGGGFEIFSNEAFDNENGLFANYGVGYKYKLDNGMALKFDLRHLLENDNGDNNLLYTVGFAIPFGEKAAKKAPMEMKKEEPKPAPMMAPKDGDKDGVYDKNDVCPNSPNGAVVDEKGCSVLVDLKINFDTNSAVIKPQYDERITGFANYLKDNKNINATIEAHTDSRGSEAYNNKLSQKRASSTVEALKAQDIDEARITPVGLGESQPISSNDTTEGRAENRRVHAIIKK